MAFDRNAEADQAYGHKPVLLDECLEALAIRPDGVYLDGTLGRAGHSLEILRRLTAGGRLIGLDRDGTALEAARVRLAEYADRVTLVHSNFSRLAEVLDDLHIDAVDGMLFDLGVSSPQLDDAERGFSYMHDAPLDMRMDRTAGLTARDVVNGWSYEELRRILFEYGEERYAPAIARHIVEHREKAPIETTGQLVEVIRSAMPPAALREKQHPAKRSFQAIRIAVNGELEELPPMLRAAAQRLHPGGRLAVISFHSLEDRIIKKTMQELATGCTCPPNFPVCVCGKKPQMKLVSRKPIVATEAELTYNPRARSAKLRVAVIWQKQDAVRSAYNSYDKNISGTAEAVKSAEDALAAAKESVVAAFDSTYKTVKDCRTTLATKRTAQSQAELDLKTATVKYRKGIISKLAYQQAQDAVTTAKLNVESAYLSLYTAYNQYELLV